MLSFLHNFLAYFISRLLHSCSEFFFGAGGGRVYGCGCGCVCGCLSGRRRHVKAVAENDDKAETSIKQFAPSLDVWQECKSELVNQPGARFPQGITKGQWKAEHPGKDVPAYFRSKMQPDGILKILLVERGTVFYVSVFF